MFQGLPTARYYWNATHTHTMHILGLASAQFSIPRPGSTDPQAVVCGPVHAAVQSRQRQPVCPGAMMSPCP
jgi:hypothetical protein